MCCIAGYKLLTRDTKSAEMAIKLFQQLLLEGQVRGRHATGVAYRDGGKVYGYKKPIPAQEFVKDDFWSDAMCYIPTEMIGHCRYSTSGDWHKPLNNQPLNNRSLALVHNGLVSMGTKEEFEARYKVTTATENDSEIILREVQNTLIEDSHLAFPQAVATALETIAAVDPPIFSLGFLQADGRVTVVRDHLRPLWMFSHPAWQMVGFASTRDIIQRAMKAMDQQISDYTLQEAEPYKVYELGQYGMSMSTEATVNIPHHVDEEWDRPGIKHPMMLEKGIDFRSHLKPATLRAIGNGLGRSEGDHRANIRESFKQYCVAAITTWEIDPNYPLFNYLFRRYELSKSQEYWACYLYGVFYHPGSVFYVMQEFPEYEKVDLGRLKRWHDANWQKLRYNTDRKYEKGHFVEMFESYLDQIVYQTSTAQEQYFTRLLVPGDPVESFHRVNKAIQKMVRFGRYAAYIYTEALHRCMGMPIAADTMFLKEAKSSRTGLAIVLGWDVARVAEGKLTPVEWVTLETEANELMQEINQEYPRLGMDCWLMESCLCAFKGLLRKTKGRYLPYYLDRMLDEIGQLQDESITQGVDWRVLYQFRRECIIKEYLGEYAIPQRWKVHKPWEFLFRDEGKLIGLEPLYRRGILRTGVTSEVEQ